MPIAHRPADTGLSTDSLTWRSAQPDVWVAVDVAGRPAGIVMQRRRSLYVATAVTGRALGQHESLALAQAALERHAATASARAALDG
jgi:hypothetical protein